MRKLRKIRILMYVLLFLASAVLLFVGYNLVKIQQVYAAGESAYKSLSEQVVVTRKTTKEGLSVPIEENSEPSDSPQSEENEAIEDEESPVISVDFEKLQEINSDAVAWIYFDDDHSYPVMQGKDNDYYLRHLYDRSYHINGTPFLDCQCARDFSDDVSIIYGHNMRDGSIFQILTEYAKPKYLKAHDQILLLTPTKDYALQVLSYQLVPSYDSIYEMKKSCLVDYIAVEDDTRYVLLSTCSYEYEGARAVVICKLSKLQ